MNINKTKLFENFADFKNIANIDILKCYDNLFDIIGIIYNIGFYVISFILIYHIISFFIFYLRQSDTIKENINNIYKEKKAKLNTIKFTKNKKGSDRNKIDDIIETNNINDKSNKNSQKIRAKKRKKKKYKKSNNNIKINENKVENIIHDNNFFYNKIEINNINNNNNKNSKRSKIVKNYSESEIMKSIAQREKESKNNNNILKYNNEEINILSYDLALQYDKRVYCEYYISLIKSKHNLIFSFYYNEDYNSKIIKIDLFFISLAGYYAINGLFFNDNTMHKIYETKGKYNLEYNIPRIIYSSLISIVLNKILKVLALSNDAILDFKQIKNKNDIDKEKNNLLNKLKIKFILYYIISSILILFFWYYISMFGAIYKNTQVHLLKDTLISFGLSLIYPFGIYLLPGIFRIPALSNRKNKKKYLYNFSKLLQML